MPPLSGCKKDSARMGHRKYPAVGFNDRWKLSRGYIYALHAGTWTTPSADAYRDEPHDLHAHIAARRIWADRELFHFQNQADFEAAIRDFETGFSVKTAAEDPYKQPRITDLESPTGATASRTLVKVRPWS